MSGEDPGSGAVFTIGQGQRDPTDLTQLLLDHRIQFLLDVRSKPYSRYNPQFSREPLAALLRTVGIRYGFFGDQLGGRPADPGCYSEDGRVDYDKCREAEFFKAGIGRLQRAQAQGFRVCLFCSEGRPTDCHRSKLIGVALSSEGIGVSHILHDGTLASQDDLMRQLTGGQTSLFGGGTGLRSRKAYLSPASALDPSYQPAESFTLEDASERF